MLPASPSSWESRGAAPLAPHVLGGKPELARTPPADSQLGRQDKPQTRRRKRRKEKRQTGRNKETPAHDERQTARSGLPGRDGVSLSYSSPSTAAPEGHAPTRCPGAGAPRDQVSTAWRPWPGPTDGRTPSKATSRWSCATTASVGTSASAWMVIAKEGGRCWPGRGQQGPRPRAAETSTEGGVGRRARGAAESGEVLDTVAQRWPSPGKDARQALGSPGGPRRLATPSPEPQDSPALPPARDSTLGLGRRPLYAIRPQPRLAARPVPREEPSPHAPAAGNALSEDRGGGPGLSWGAWSLPQAEAEEWFKCLIPTGRPMSSRDSVAGLPPPSQPPPLPAPHRCAPRARDGTPGVALGVPQASRPAGRGLWEGAPPPRQCLTPGAAPCLRLRLRGRPSHFPVPRGEAAAAGREGRPGQRGRSPGRGSGGAGPGGRPHPRPPIC